MIQARCRLTAVRNATSFFSVLPANIMLRGTVCLLFTLCEGLYVSLSLLTLVVGCFFGASYWLNMRGCWEGGWEGLSAVLHAQSMALMAQL